MDDRNDTDVTEVAGGNTDSSHDTDVPYYNGKVYRSWVFTLNNYHDDDLENMESWLVKRLVAGIEISSTGTPHVQGYVTFTCGKRLMNCKKLLPTARWAVAQAIDAENYSMKEGTILRIDLDNRQQGQRTDIKNGVKCVKEGGIKKLIDDEPEIYVKFNNGFEKLASRLKKPRVEKPFVEWIWGPKGVGKTRGVMEKESDIWVSGEDLKWFDGYENQEAVLFDDFRADMCKFRWLLRLLDRYPVRVQLKGSSIEFTPKRIYITSCKHPSDVYSKDTFDNDEKVDQLIRRIDLITHMSETTNLQDLFFP